MEKIAWAVGFGRDGSHLGETSLSGGDWKGSSIAICVFAQPEYAENFLAQCLRVLDAFGDGPKGDVLTVPSAYGGVMYIAVLTAVDLATASEVAAGAPETVAGF